MKIYSKRHPLSKSSTDLDNIIRSPFISMSIKYEALGFNKEALKQIIDNFLEEVKQHGPI